jgi:ankyrin repeat protein
MKRIIFLPFFVIGLFSCISYSNREIKDPLYRAINNGNLDEVQDLVLKGESLNQHTGWSYYPLEYAAQNGKTEIVEYLISQGAGDINIAFQSAMGRRIFDTAKVLYQTGKINDIAYEDSFVAMFNSPKRNLEDDIEIINMITDNKLPKAYLLLFVKPEEYSIINERYKIDVSEVLNENGENLLHIGARRTNFELIEYLLDNKININSCDNNGNTALFYAVSAAGPNLDWNNPFFEDENEFKVNRLSIYSRGDPVVMNMGGFDRQEKWIKFLNTMCVLLKGGIDINLQNNIGWTALHLSYIKYSEIIPELLINYGADINIKTKIGRLPNDFK